MTAAREIYPSLRNKPAKKTNHVVNKIVKSGNNNKSVVVHEDTDLDLQEAETEEVLNDLEIDEDENIFEVVSLYRS